MNARAPLLLTALTTAFLLGAADGKPESTRFDALAAEHFRQIGTPAGAAWEESFAQTHSTAWNEDLKACADDALAAGLAEFDLLLVVDAEGRVVEVLRKPDREQTQCFARRIVGRQYAPPPEAPFYELVGVTLVADDAPPDAP